MAYEESYSRCAGERCAASVRHDGVRKNREGLASNGAAKGVRFTHVVGGWGEGGIALFVVKTIIQDTGY